MPGRYPYHEKSEVGFPQSRGFTSASLWLHCTSAKEKTFWRRLASHVCIYNHLLPHLKDRSGTITNLLAMATIHICNWRFSFPWFTWVTVLMIKRRFFSPLTGGPPMVWYYHKCLLFLTWYFSHARFWVKGLCSFRWPKRFLHGETEIALGWALDWRCLGW